MYKMARPARLKLALLSMSALSAAALPNMAWGQSAAPAQATYDFNIPSQSLARSLSDIAERANIQVIYPENEPISITAPAIKGNMTVEQALATALAGSPYSFSFARPGVVTLVAKGGEGPDGERVLGAVRVQGSQGGASSLPGSSPINGINGSRDVTATEGTGSYTSNALTVGSKIAATIKETPMAVSVITNQRIEDQKLNDIRTVLKNAPGISFSDGNGTDYNFYSRGFTIMQFQFDGGAPINTGMGYRPVMDMSLYDHVEIVRGATGTFNAYGDPGGVINLVRKKPLDHSQMLLDFQLGSWDLHRVSADITGPLAFGGKLRGRLIATHQDNKYFYVGAKTSTSLVSGSLEYDLTPSTLFSAGFNYQVEKGNNAWGGFPRYLDGRPLDLPRSTFLGFDWLGINSDNRELYGRIEKKIGANWNLKINGSHIYQIGSGEVAGISGAVNPYTGDGMNAAYSQRNHYILRENTIEASIDGSLTLFGRQQKVVFGTSYVKNDFSGSTSYLGTVFLSSGSLFLPFNIADINKTNFDIDRSLEGLSGRTGPYYDNTINAYASFDISMIKNLHTLVSFHYSRYNNFYFTPTYCPPLYANRGWCVLGQANIGGDYIQITKGRSFSWPPSVQWRYDVSDSLSTYAAYTDIYIDHSFLKTRDGAPLAPVTGGNLEGGLKWLSKNRKVNINLSGYYTRKQNIELYDQDFCRPPAGAVPDKCTSNAAGNPGQAVNLFSCCFLTDPYNRQISYGADVELAGELRRGWQISASYNFNTNYYRYRKNHFLLDGSRTPLTPYSPQHLFKVWSTYAFPESGSFSGLSFGLGASGQTKTQVQDSYCTKFVADPQPTNPDAKTCTETRDVFFADPGHIVFGGSVGYKLNSILRVDVNVENIFDKKYFQTVGGIYGGNWYGAPRSFNVSIHGKW